MAMEIFTVGRGQEGYPERLMPFADMPSRLFVRGALPADEQKTAAIVGARICTAYGKSQAAFFAQVLAANGVAGSRGLAGGNSALACGIDAAAHEGALRGKGKTFAVLGCGVEIKSAHNKNIESFNLDNLRWDKVIICTDADVDGFQIRTLVLTMIYRLMPTLIEKGKVYIAESPLYEITITKTKRKGEKHFAYTDGEKEEILKKFTEDGLSKERDEYDIKRSKGLGENEPDMMSLTTMHPSTRRLIRVTPENAESTSRMFDVLLGDNITDRKEYIADNGGKYMEMLDLS